MKVTELIEHDDGSATVTFDITNEEAAKLIEYAMLDLLTKAVKATKEANE